ncbi:hypothetical protein ACS0TY_026101 [Phlomoides rotata]
MADPSIGKGRVGGKSSNISSLSSLFEQPLECSPLLGFVNSVGDHVMHDPIEINVETVALEQVLPTNTLIPTLDDFPPLKESVGKGLTMRGSGWKKDGVVKEVSSENRVEEAVLNMDIDENRHDSDETILEECPIEVECSAKNKPKAWSKGESSKIFKSNRAPSIDVRLKFMKSDSDVVEIPSHGISRAWDSTLIGYFTGRFPGLKATHDLCKKWGVKYSLSNHDSGWLLFKLSSEVDVESVLNGGPYSIWGHTLMLKKCHWVSDSTTLKFM